MMLHKLIAMRDRWYRSAMHNFPIEWSGREREYFDDHANNWKAGYYDCQEELDALIQECGWQPIETAPRDGRLVILINPSGYIYTGEWRYPMRGGRGYINYKQWCDRAERVGIPTHWMPLPDPPAEQKE